MALPEFQSALVAVKEGQYTLNTTHPLPSHTLPPPTYVLIWVSFVALNPCNWKMINFSPAIGTVGGNDFSGHVVATGAAVSKWRIGDSVCGFLYGLNPHVSETEGEWAGGVCAVCERARGFGHARRRRQGQPGRGGVSGGWSGNGGHGAAGSGHSINRDGYHSWTQIRCRSDCRGQWESPQEQQQQPVYPGVRREYGDRDHGDSTGQTV